MKLTSALLLAAMAATSAARNCGFKIAPCPSDQECIPLSADCTDLNRCLGLCTPKPSYQPCGGMVKPPLVGCPKGTTCRDDPRVPGCGMACDRLGICIPDDAPQCAGFAGFRCPRDSGLMCYDLPNDGCDPEDGGRDCIGVCLKPKAPQVVPYGGN